MASLPTGTPNASTASLTLYPPSSPQEDSFDFAPEDSYDLVSPSELDSPDSDPQKEHTPPPQLPAWLVVPAMMTPSLSLGALLLPHTLESIPIVLGAVMLLLAIVIGAGVQSIWRGAGRYVRRETVEERVAEAFVGSGRGVRREKWKKLVGGITKAGMLATGVGLCVVYVRSAVQLLVPHLSPHINASAAGPLLALVFAFLLIPGVYIQQLRYLPLLHVALYIAFLITSLVMLFGSRSPAAATATATVSAPTLSSIFHQERAALSVNSFFQSIATLLILPITLAPPYFPAVRPLIPALSACLAPVLLLPLVVLPSTYPSSSPLAVSILASILLFLSAIRLSRTVIRPRAPGIKLSVVLWALGAALAALPEEWGVPALLWDFTLSSLLYFGYVLPALVHLILHHLRAPLAILFPSSAPMDGAHDALLLKKERSMQHKRETKRLLQDLLLFGVLLPGGLTVWGWSLGRFVRLW
ncbi:hypothetical protein CALCODRAFT_480856 [Calocera cornea HHB12733]|uniref:Amino acid transporter transmembrane domain-containing protein n=1 Tax=Calocera cornea HHB12733 TaxID=1353952 RepID=A0A165IB07_9BASI|nr:hypothetical protein CALCODRAFT_480856 [Calocera cornea HHB12733]